MDYSFTEIEKKWQKRWADTQVYKAEINADKPKFYVLDMFPYPSGAGLHVGHPLGYIASDIYARYKRLQGFNVLHPMGYDSFGLPAEQYAIETGQHPATTTEKNIQRYRKQLDNIGFSFDWSKELRTSNPDYYRWTQWIFIQFFNAWYDSQANKARPISDLIGVLNEKGNQQLPAVCDTDTPIISASQWQAMPEEQQQNFLLKYRLAYLSESMVNWCTALGTVLANDEVKDGVSERGGHPVEQRKMMQWSMRITAYAERLLNDLNTIDWSDSIKDIQRNWIGKSVGAAVHFQLSDHPEKIEVFTTRPDTIFGVSFMVLAPEHVLVEKITTAQQKAEVNAYIEKASKKSERERMADVKTISGAFTGAYVIHPFTQEKIQVWISDYVLAGYGTGAIMAVPAGDERDWRFASHFNLPIPSIFVGHDVATGALEDKQAVLCNSDFLNTLTAQKAISKAIAIIEEKGLGSGRINYKLRDAVFGRQRYWGEPIPIYYKNGIPYPVEEKHLPIELPEIDAFLPTETGEPPLARAKKWNYHPEKGVVANGEGYPLELTTMPGWAGSSWYFMRYTDPNNASEFASQHNINYWQNVDLYMGGAEHATGHLLYARFWTKFMNDMGLVQFNEPAKKLINQGMIQGVSKFAHRLDGTNTFVSFGKINGRKTIGIHVDVSIVDEEILDVEAFKKWRVDFENAKFELEDDSTFRCSSEVEKMSKSKYNVVNPDELCDKHGADALRLHEMFLGPVEMHKPWNTKGIEGVSKFLRKLWRLYHNAENNFEVSESVPTKQELKVLHQCIKRVQDDLERFSFNTCVSHFMICVNELGALNCNKRAILEPLAVLVSCNAPHLAEELWERLGNTSSISEASFPQFVESHLVENSFDYPISFNGKVRFKLTLPLSLEPSEVQEKVLSNDLSTKWLEAKTPKKIIVVKGKIVNIVM